MMKKIAYSWIKSASSFIVVPFILIVLIFAASCEKDDPNDPDGPPVTAQTDTITENIDTRTVLSDRGEGIDYYVCGGIDVNAELIIEPGVNIIMCSGAGIYVSSSGSLNAIGTAQKPISISGEVASPGYWAAIEIKSNNPENVFEYVTIKHGGGDDWPYDNSSVWVNNASNAQLTLKNSTISHSKKYGLVVENGASLPGFSNNIFSNNGNAGIKIPFSIIGSMDKASNYADGNTNNYIHVFEATVNQDQTVKVTDVPYFIVGIPSIEAGLDLDPGVDFLMDTGAGLYIASTGYFSAVGNATDPIRITGAVSTPGYWNTIEINSNNPNNEFAHVEVKYGGGDDWPYSYSSIWVNNANNGSFKIHDCIVSDSYGWGFYAENGTTLTPNNKSEILNVNTFSNNGTGPSASCTGDCNVYLQ